jgi:hypothetical protein
MKDVTFNPSALLAIPAMLVVFAIAGFFCDTYGVSYYGALVLAVAILAVLGVMAKYAGMRRPGFIAFVVIAGGVFVALTVLRLLWKLVVFAWN